MYKQQKSYYVSQFFVVFISLPCHTMNVHTMLHEPKSIFSKEVIQIFQHMQKKNNKPYSQIKQGSVFGILLGVPVQKKIRKEKNSDPKPLISSMPLTYQDTESSLRLEPNDEIMLTGDFFTLAVDNQTIKTLAKEGKKTLNDIKQKVTTIIAMSPIEEIQEAFDNFNTIINENKQQQKRIHNLYKRKRVHQEEITTENLNVIDKSIDDFDFSNIIQPVEDPNPSFDLVDNFQGSSTSENHGKLSNMISKFTDFFSKDPEDIACDNVQKNTINRVLVKKLLTIAATFASVIYVWKKVNDKKTDEEVLSDEDKALLFNEDETLLSEFNDKINNELVSHQEKMDITHRALYRLIDCEKGIFIPLLKSVLDQYEGNNQIVKTVLQERTDDRYIMHTVANALLKPAIKQLHLETIKLLFSSMLYRYKQNMNYYDGHIPQLYESSILKTIFTTPESKTKEDCLIFLLTKQYYNQSDIVANIFCSHDYIEEQKCEERIEKYVTRCWPHIHGESAINETFCELQLTQNISPVTHKRIQTFFLESGKIPHCSNIYQLIYSLTEEYVDRFGSVRSKRSVSDFVQSRIDAAKQLLSYGLKCLNYEKDIEERKNMFRAIEDGKFLHVPAKETKDSICNALDTIKTIISKEEEFREQFFNYHHEKNYYQLLEKLRQNYPRPAWWIMRILKDRKCDISTTDISHIPSFCFKQICSLFLSYMQDAELEKEMQPWQDLLIFLFTKTPEVFNNKNVSLEKSKGEYYTVSYKNQKEEIDRLPLCIVEQGYYEKQKTYKTLRPLLKHCITSDKFIPDISVQNGTEGSIIHLFARKPFDMLMVKLFFKVYKKKDRRALYLACSQNNRTHFSDELSTPQHIAEQMLQSCEDEDQRKPYQEMIEILQYEVPKLKLTVSVHSPHIDTIIANPSSKKKTIEWQLAHCPNI